MASIFRKPRSPFFFAAYRDADGRRVQRTTKQTTRAKAIEVAQAWGKLAAKARARTLTESQARRVVSEILESVTGEPLHFHSCREYMNEWLAGKKGTVEESTFTKYGQVINDFLEGLGERADLTLSAVSPKDVRAFRDAIFKEGLSAKTVNQTIRSILSVFAAAVRLGYIPINPCDAIQSLRDDEDIDAARDNFTTEQVRSLLREAEGDWKGVILAGYFTGLRLRDITELRWSAINLDDGILRIKARKTGATLTIPLHVEFTEWLRRQTRGIGQAPVFPTLAGKETAGRNGLSAMFAAIMAKGEILGRVTRNAGGKGRKTKSLSFHSLRHSFVSALANAGVPAEVRKKLSGHADERVHAKYTHHEIDTLTNAIGKLPRVVNA